MLALREISWVSYNSCFLFRFVLEDELKGLTNLINFVPAVLQKNTYKDGHSAETQFQFPIRNYNSFLSNRTSEIRYLKQCTIFGLIQHELLSRFTIKKKKYKSFNINRIVIKEAFRVVIT